MGLGKGFLSVIASYYSKFIIQEDLLSEILKAQDIPTLKKKLRGSIYYFDEEEYWKVEKEVLSRVSSIIRDIIEASPSQLSIILSLVYTKRDEFISSLTGEKRVKYQKFLAEVKSKVNSICGEVEDKEREAILSFISYKLYGKDFERVGDEDLSEVFELLYRLEEQTKTILRKLRELWWKKLSVSSKEIATLLKLFTLQDRKIAFVDLKDVERVEDDEVKLPLYLSSKPKGFWKVEEVMGEVLRG